MTWVNDVVQGLLLGGLYALFATGLSLMFGVMRLVNFAHGDVISFSIFATCALMPRSCASFSVLAACTSRIWRSRLCSSCSTRSGTHKAHDHNITSVCLLVQYKQAIE